MSRAASLAIILIALAVAGCSGDDNSPPGLRITREDGSVVEIGRTLHAWCGLPRFDPDPKLSLQIVEGDRVFDDADDVPSYWMFYINVDRLKRTTRLAVPQVPVDTTSWVFFVNDVERDSEAATYKGESSGSIEVKRWGCEKGDVVTLTVDALVASEYGLEAVRARGTVTAEIGAEPDGYSG